MKTTSIRTWAPFIGRLFPILLACNAFAGPTHELVYGFSQTTQNPDGDSPLASLVGDGAGHFWGTTQLGGADNFGTVYKINQDTGAFTKVVDFTNNGATNKGNSPLCKLLPDGDGFLWGTTYYGGANGTGTIFKININTGQLVTLFEFDGRTPGTSRGSHPHAGLANDGTGNLWGTAQLGGSHDHGTVFKLNMGTSTMTRVASFTGGSGNIGYWPTSRLADDGAGYFWGTTAHTSSNSDYAGTVFKVNKITGELTSVRQFSSVNIAGYYPRAELVDDGLGNMWSTTDQGGTSGKGTVFKINKATGTHTTAANLTIGANSIASVVADDSGYFWGTTRDGGTNGKGTIFRINQSTNVLTTVLDMGNPSQVANGGSPDIGTLVRHSDGNIYGTTKNGGPGGKGTVFRLRFGPTPVTQAADNIASTSAMLHGTANSNNDGATTTRFEYATSPTLAGAMTTNDIIISNSAAAAAVSASIESLIPDTTYYFRVTASNAGNAVTQKGQILSFTTAPPVISTNLTALSISEGTLEPAFASATTAYTATVAYSNAEITVTPVAESVSSTIRVRSNGGSYVTVASGSASAPIVLENGANLIDVEVTAADTTTKTYTIEVTRTYPVIVVKSAGTVVTDGNAVPVDFGPATRERPSSVQLTIHNEGTENLILGAIQKDGPGTNDFSVETPGSTTLAPGADTTLAVTFSRGAGGGASAAIHIPSNVSGSTNPYDVNLAGTGFSYTADTDGDGMNDAAEFNLATLGFDWNSSQPAMVAALDSGANSAGYYNSTQIQGLHLGTPLLSRDPVSGQFVLRLRIAKSTDLLQFDPFPAAPSQVTINAEGQIEFRFDPPDDSAFFRIEAE